MNIENISYAPYIGMPISALKWTAKAFSSETVRVNWAVLHRIRWMTNERTDVLHVEWTASILRYVRVRRFMRVFFASRLAITATPRACKRSSKWRTICTVALLFLHRKFFIVSSRRVNARFSPFFSISAFKSVQCPRVTLSLLLTQRCASSLSRHLASN